MECNAADAAVVEGGIELLEVESLMAPCGGPEKRRTRAIPTEEDGDNLLVGW
jgi:hypothetical protein